MHHEYDSICALLSCNLIIKIKYFLIGISPYDLRFKMYVFHLIFALDYMCAQSTTGIFHNE